MSGAKRVGLKLMYVGLIYMCITTWMPCLYLKWSLYIKEISYTYNHSINGYL